MHTLMGIRDLLMLYRSAPTGLSCADMFELREFTMVLYLFRNTCLIAIGGPLVNRFLGTDHEETLVDALQKKHFVLGATIGMLMMCMQISKQRNLEMQTLLSKRAVQSEGSGASKASVVRRIG